MGGIVLDRKDIPSLFHTPLFRSNQTVNLLSIPSPFHSSLSFFTLSQPTKQRPNLHPFHLTCLYLLLHINCGQLN